MGKFRVGTTKVKIRMQHFLVPKSKETCNKKKKMRSQPQRVLNSQILFFTVGFQLTKAEGIENHHLVNTTRVILLSKIHQWILKLMYNKKLA